MASVLSDRWRKSILETATNESLPSNVTRLPNGPRGCVEGSQEGLIISIEEYRIAPLPTKKRKCSGKFSKDWIRLFGDSLLNESWVRQSTLGVFCVHAT